MSLINKTNFLSKYLKELAIFLKYSTREKLFLFFAVALFVLGSWFKSLELKESDSISVFLKTWQSQIFLGLCAVAAGFVIYVFYRYLSKIALVRQTGETKELASSIKGLMAFTNEDGALFLRLERDKELIELKNHINNSQIPFVVVMGESGAGKTSLLRAGLSYLLQDTETKYIYWEALPRDAVGGLLKAINTGLALPTEISQLTELLTLPNKAVIVLDQFEQLLPDKIEFAPIFDLLKQVIVAAPPHSITWIIAFRREYLPHWRDFELENKLQPNMLSLKLLSLPQAQTVLVTLAEAAGLTLEQALVDGFIQTVQKEERVSPVDIGIGLLMLQELATQKQTQQLSLVDYHFAGGSQGLFVSFLKNKIEQRFPEQYEQEGLFKALLELIDLNRNQRVAEGKTLAELATKAEGLSLQYLEFGLDYLASVQVRLLEKISRADGLAAYRLPHESMIPALRQLGNNLLGEIAQANLTLQMAFTAWQNSAAKDSKFLLSGKDLKTVLKFKEQLDLHGKVEFLRLSKKKQQLNLVIKTSIVLAFLAEGSYELHYLWQEAIYQQEFKVWEMDENLLEYSSQIKELSINKNVYYLDWLKKFSNLNSIKLFLNKNITDISILNELEKLNKLDLDLRDSQINTLNNLQNLKSLTTLNLRLSYSKTTDTNVLKNLTNLNSLTISGEISDIHFLTALKNLTTLQLDLGYSNISNITVLQELKGLTTLSLNLGSSTITDISALKELKSLNSLQLNLINAMIVDISVLKELKNLTTVDLKLDSSPFTDISVLEDMEKLTTLRLYLPYSNIANLSTLGKLKNLAILDLDLQNTNITDISELKELRKLTSVRLKLDNSQMINFGLLKNIPSKVIQIEH